jgi:hypothetical protein
VSGRSQAARSSRTKASQEAAADVPLVTIPRSRTC